MALNNVAEEHSLILGMKIKTRCLAYVRFEIRNVLLYTIRSLTPFVSPTHAIGFHFIVNDGDVQ